MIMEINHIAIFDEKSRIRVFLDWKNSQFMLESVAGFDTADVSQFLDNLSRNKPGLKFEKNGAMYRGLVQSPNADAYRFAVLDELKH